MNIMEIVKATKNRFTLEFDSTEINILHYALVDLEENIKLGKKKLLDTKDVKNIVKLTLQIEKLI